MTYFSRSCCDAPEAVGIVYDLVETPISTFSGPVVSTAVIPPAPQLHVAIHEAAHALFSHLYGLELSEVRVTWPAQCVGAQAKRLPPRKLIALKLSGGIAEDRLRRFTYRSPTEAIAPYFDKIRALRLGRCDECQAALCAVATVGATAGDEVAANLWREGEALAIETLSAPECWIAVRDLADALMTVGILNGAAAHELLERHVPFGSRCELSDDNSLKETFHV